MTQVLVEVRGHQGHTCTPLKLFVGEPGAITKVVETSTPKDENKKLGDLIAKLIGQGVKAGVAAAQAESMIDAERSKDLATANRAKVSARIVELMEGGQDAVEAAEQAKEELDVAAR